MTEGTWRVGHDEFYRLTDLLDDAMWTIRKLREENDELRRQLNGGDRVPDPPLYCQVGEPRDNDTVGVD